MISFYCKYMNAINTFTIGSYVYERIYYILNRYLSIRSYINVHLWYYTSNHFECRWWRQLLAVWKRNQVYISGWTCSSLCILLLNFLEGWEVITFVGFLLEKCNNFFCLVSIFSPCFPWKLKSCTCCSFMCLLEMQLQLCTYFCFR